MWGWGVWGSGWEGRGEEVLEFVLSPMCSVHKRSSRKLMISPPPEGELCWWCSSVQHCCVHVPQATTRPRTLLSPSRPPQLLDRTLNVTHLAGDFPRGRTVLVVVQLCCVHVLQDMTRPGTLLSPSRPPQLLDRTLSHIRTSQAKKTSLMY